MKKNVAQPLIKFLEQSDSDDEQEERGGGRGVAVMAKKVSDSEDDSSDIADMTENTQCMTIYKRQARRKGLLGEELFRGKYGLWKREPKSGTARLEKQLKAKWKFEELIEEQLNHFDAHYNCNMIPTRLKDVSRILNPKWAVPHELATLSWFGDWRPSAILDLLRVLSASFASSMSSSLSESKNIERRLSQLVNEIRIEEAIIDGEMAEIQATCILHLPFAPIKKYQSSTAALSCIETEFKKIGKVIIKAQQLRLKTLEMVVKKVLNETDAAEFLVAFAGIQDMIHQFASKQKSRKAPLTAPARAPWDLIKSL